MLEYLLILVVRGMQVVAWNDIIVGVAIVGHQVALVAVTVKLDLGWINSIDWHQVIYAINLDSDLVLVVLGCLELSLVKIDLILVVRVIVAGVCAIVESFDVIVWVAIVRDQRTAVVVASQLSLVSVNLVKWYDVGDSVSLDDGLIG